MHLELRGLFEDRRLKGPDFDLALFLIVDDRARECRNFPLQPRNRARRSAKQRC